MCAWCIQNVHCNKIGVIDAFSSSNSTKPQKEEYFQRQANNKQGTADDLCL